MSPRVSKEVVEIDEGGATQLAARVGMLRETEGWINLTPGVPSDVAVEPQRSLFTWLVGPPGPSAPLATWMPATPGSTRAGKLGVLHARGRLNREGIAGLVSIPPSWRCLGDHARRGLIFEVTDATDLEVAESMISVVEELTTLPTTGRYLAEVFTRPS
jgi:hypothetical protein